MSRSMTAYASATGAAERFTWSWELRSVNARGLDLRLRVPDWIDGLEPGLRAMLQKALARGSVSVSLRIGREASGAAGEDGPETEALDRALAQVAAIHARAGRVGLALAPSTAGEILQLSGGQGARQASAEDIAALSRALLTGFERDVLAPFVAMRTREGAAIAQVLGAQIDAIADLVARAVEQAEARGPQRRADLDAAIARVTGATDAVDEGRLAQELALLAVKADVTEEIDRLRTHVGAARETLAQEGPVGRKLDFLTQEFNREANTLCSKSQDARLTATGLELKAVIDQLREQVQNLE